MLSGLFRYTFMRRTAAENYGSLFHKINQTLFSELRTHSTKTQLSEVAVRISQCLGEPFLRVSILLYNPSTERLEIYGCSEKKRIGTQIAVNETARHIIAAVWRDGLTRRENDISKPTEYPQIEASGSAGSELTVLIRSRGSKYGVLDVQGEKPNEFDSRDELLIGSLADALGVVFDNERLASERWRQLLDLTVATLESLIAQPDVEGLCATIVCQAAESLEADLCVLFEVIPETGALHLPPHICGDFEDSGAMEYKDMPPDASPIFELIKGWRAVFVPDVRKEAMLKNSDFIRRENVVSMSFLPLGVDAKHGVLFVNYREQKDLGQDKEREWLEAYARVAGLALEHAHGAGHSARNLERLLQQRGFNVHDVLAKYTLPLKEHIRELNSDLLENEYETRRSREALQLADATIDHLRLQVLLAAAGLGSIDFSRTSLLAALNDTKAQIEIARRNTLRIRLSISPEVERESAELKEILHRATAEAVDNAARHGRASAVEVTIVRESRQIVLQVLDDGHGFDTEKLSLSPFGLHAFCREVEKRLDAKYDFTSQIGKGTVFRLTIPV